MYTDASHQSTGRYVNGSRAPSSRIGPVQSLRSVDGDASQIPHRWGGVSRERLMPVRGPRPVLGSLVRTVSPAANERRYGAPDNAP